MITDITILGSGTCNLAADKAGASVVLSGDDFRLMYDIGRGNAVRLTEAGYRQDDIEHIFISHFHPDHLTDILPYLHAASWSQIDQRSKDLHLYGPAGLQTFMTNMLGLFGHEELQRDFTVTVHELAEGDSEIAGQPAQFVDLHHSLGVRFGAVAIAGDSVLHNDLVQLLQGAAIGVFDSGHLSDEEICQLASRCQAERLVCSHQYRPLNEVALNKQAAELGYTGRLIVAHDLMKIAV